MLSMVCSAKAKYDGTVQQSRAFLQTVKQQNDGQNLLTPIKHSYGYVILAMAHNVFTNGPVKSISWIKSLLGFFWHKTTAKYAQSYHFFHNYWVL